MSNSTEIRLGTPLDWNSQTFETSEDGFLGGRLRVRQPKHGPRASIDALLLAAAVPNLGNRPQQILEAGTGSGIVSLALAFRLPHVRLVAIDIEPALCALAEDNVQYNGFGDRIEVVEADVTAPVSDHARLRGLTGQFDWVIANPPFFVEGEGRVSHDRLKKRAHLAGPSALTDWVRFLTAMAAPQGCLTIIHVPSELGRLINCLEGRFGALVVFPVFPKNGAKAKRIIVSGLKGSKAPLRMAQGLVLHQENGCFTDDAEAILRDGLPFEREKDVRCL